MDVKYLRCFSTCVTTLAVMSEYLLSLTCPLTRLDVGFVRLGYYNALLKQKRRAKYLYPALLNLNHHSESVEALPAEEPANVFAASDATASAEPPSSP